MHIGGELFFIPTAMELESRLGGFITLVDNTCNTPTNSNWGIALAKEWTALNRPIEASILEWITKLRGDEAGHLVGD